jgi:hypothetical protein
MRRDLLGGLVIVSMENVNLQDKPFENWRPRDISSMADSASLKASELGKACNSVLLNMR